MKIAHLSREEILKKLSMPRKVDYFCYYSSFLGGISSEAQFMLIPLDDHMVHRGDGVFEALRLAQGRVYLLQEHMNRMAKSAQSIGLNLYQNLQSMKEIVLATAEASISQSKQKDGLVRVFLSRGQGSFAANPYDSEGSQFFVVITKISPPAKEKYDHGVSVGLSQIPVKDSWMAQVKSCNYLPNVMMKKESVDRGLDFVVNFDRSGFLAESSTENMVIVDANGVLTRPHLENILRGTTMTRVFDLAKAKFACAEKNISPDDIKKAREVILLGTTIDVLPVVEYEGEKIADGKVGPLAKELLAMLKEDQLSPKPQV